MKPIFVTAAAAAILCGSAWAAPADKPGHESPAPGTNTEAMSATEDTVAGLIGTVTAEMTTTTQGFVTAAATSDMYEVTAGHIALERSQSPKVKAFAQEMIDAHTKTTDTLKGILSASAISVTPPAHVDSRRQSMLDNLRGAAAADFDHRYVTQQVAAHKEADILMRGYAKSGDNAKIRAFAKATDSHVKQHLTMAQALAKTK